MISAKYQKVPYMSLTVLDMGLELLGVNTSGFAGWHSCTIRPMDACMPTRESQLYPKGLV